MELGVELNTVVQSSFSRSSHLTTIETSIINLHLPTLLSPTLLTFLPKRRPRRYDATTLSAQLAQRLRASSIVTEFASVEFYPLELPVASIISASNMAPPPSASLPLQERVLALMKTLQCKHASIVELGPIIYFFCLADLTFCLCSRLVCRVCTVVTRFLRSATALSRYCDTAFHVASKKQEPWLASTHNIAHRIRKWPEARDRELIYRIF